MKIFGVLNTKAHPNASKKNLHTSNVLQPPSILELQPSKTMSNHPKPNGGIASPH